MSEHIVIVGASLAGLTAAEAMLESGYKYRVTVVGDEPYMPYDRPPLSKSVLLGKASAAATALPRRATFPAGAVEWRLGHAAARLDIYYKKLLLANGDVISFDKLLIATGARARAWHDEEQARLGGVVVLRGRDDAQILQDLLKARPSRVLIVGGGFMGSEIASACRTLGLAVTVIQRGPAPLASALGFTIARRVSRLQLDNGVDLRCNVTVEKLEGDESQKLCRAYLDDGSILEADVAVIALGADPNTEWLSNAGLRISSSGITCDSSCRVFGGDLMVRDDIFVAGDVARFLHPHLPDRFVGLEHWENACDMARIAAHNMMCDPDKRRAHLPVPAFWSSQFNTNIKSLGILHAADSVVIAQGSFSSGSFVAVYGMGGQVVGAVSFNRGRNLPGYLPMIAGAGEFPPIMQVSEPSDNANILPAGFPPFGNRLVKYKAAITGYDTPNRDIRWIPLANEKTHTQGRVDV